MRDTAFLLALAPVAAPAAAQQATPAPATTVPPAASAVPPPISWSLPPGPGSPPNVPPVVAPVRVAPTPRPTPRPTATPRATVSPRAAAAPRPRALATPTPTPSAPLPTAAPLAAPTASAPIDVPAPTPSIPAAVPVPVPPPASAPPAPLWRADWLIAGALVLLAGGALLLWWRRRPVAGAGVEDVALVPAEPMPLSPPLPPRLTEPLVGVGGERARLTLALRPRRGGINLLTATLDAELEIVNAGAAPATAVHVAARLLSAHRDQQAELAASFAQPLGRPAVAPFALAPGERRVLPLLLTLPRASIVPIDMAGRAMFVPVAAVDVRYASGEGEAQSAAAFAVGVEREGAAKLAPFWLDAPARMHERLGVRAHGEPVTR
ncbi:hypothetical protein KZ813_09445 [Sphingomonas sp. RHCKR7]|uniref:hypothetical protein n=1 Tax=Sphingomonas folli TaxID=2862497 RepID=UPI001CA5CFD8|nr:hypothetical protein [Sphingomonas folli]MBW6527060.1 hypothetical protein [Sphingomonas folli]